MQVYGGMRMLWGITRAQRGRCGAEAAVLCVRSGGGGAVVGHWPQRGGAALVVTRFSKDSTLGFGGSSGRFCNRFSAGANLTN